MKLLAALRLLVGTSFRVAPSASMGSLAETAGVIVALGPSWMLALFVDAAANGDTEQMITTAAAFVAQIAVARLLFVIGMNARMNQLERVGDEFAGRIAHLTATIPTIDGLDDPNHLDQLHILREQRGALGLAVNTLLNQLNGLVGLIGVLTLAAAADPRMLLVAAASIPTVLTGPLIARWQGQSEAASAESGRLARTLLALAIAPQHAGEIRVFQMAGPLRERQTAASRAWRAPMLGLAIRESALTAATQILFFGVAIAVLAWLVNDTLTGAVTIADTTLALLLVTRLQGISSDLRSIISEVAGIGRTAGRYLWLVELATSGTTDDGETSEPPTAPAGLQLHDVSYRYPGADHDALRHVSLVLEPGTVLAIVGENGAGKSTLAELVAGFRTPTAGNVVSGGVNLRTIAPAIWQQQVSGAFQDHVRFEFLLSDTVGIGDLARRTEAERVQDAITAGAADAVVAAVPIGVDTQLGLGWPGGVELSGGQWQRLAIARAMMRTTPLIRVLDEPTAALDALTEHQLFGRYTHAAHSGRAVGTITLLITHRFSTAAAADLIIVLDHGRITEQGTHRQLLSARGHYADLYHLQARGYRPSQLPDRTAETDPPPYRP